MQRRTILNSIAAAAAGVGLMTAGNRAARAQGAGTGAPVGRVPPVPFIGTADGTQLFYKDWGRGKPIVFIHSWAMNADMWDYQTVAFAGREQRCVAYDRRGHGRSSQPGQGYDYDTLADDLAAVITHLDLREATLVGHSMGGGEIVRFLGRHGAGRIARIVLLAPTTPFLLKTADNPDGIDGKIFEHVRTTIARDYPKWLVDNARPFVMPETSQAMIDWLIGLMLQCPLKVALDLNRAVIDTDFRAELRAVKVPTLVIHGDADKSAPLPITGQRTAQLIPGATFKLYEGAPHGLFVTHKDRVNADLRAFIQG